MEKQKGQCIPEFLFPFVFMFMGLIIGVAIICMSNIIGSILHGKVRAYEKKEELFVFVNHHRTELDDLLEEMKEAYAANGEEDIYLSDRNLENDDSFPLAKTLLREYPIRSIFVHNEDDSTDNKTLAIKLNFKMPNDSILTDNYWGVYYTEMGKPLPHSSDSELTESGGIYYSTYGCIYETETITGNWYYYQERY